MRGGFLTSFPDLYSPAFPHCVCVCVCVQNKRWAVEPGNEAKDSLLPSVLAIQCHEYHPCRTGCHTAVHVLGCV